ncbi:MAG: TonB-dependent receptor plug domain-containing protein [Candidatus Delongbacteria bacterium]|nr:TonB-dependent receptor plug domain-containing protein [Candidatus Delongbacteria bacterium]MBN2836054.1 TonB-dependent receptor plug domain-containing protein [Candidatus Delongbacteria bacterium]
MKSLSHNVRNNYLIILLIVNSLFAGSRIVGTVADEFGNPISNVNILIYPTTMGNSTNSSGEFYFGRLEDGKFILKFSHVAFEEKEIEFESGAKDILDFNITLVEKDLVMPEISFIVDKSESGVKSVISRREIDQTKSSNLQDILKVGSSVVIDNSNGVSSKISIRGAESKQVTVLLDGVVLNSAMDGSVDLRSIPSEIIERVEVYKGGDLKLSSQAIGGIINIITRKNYSETICEVKYTNKGYFSDRDNSDGEKFDNHSTSVSLSTGNDNYGLIVNGSFSSDLNRWSYIDAAKANEILYINNPNISKIRKNAEFKSYNLFTKLSLHQMKSKPELLMTLNKKHTGMPGFIGKLYYNSYIESKEVISSIKNVYIENDNLNFKSEINGSYSEKDILIDEKVTVFNADYTDYYSSFGAKINLDYKNFIETFSGISFNRDAVDSKNLDGFHKRDNISVFIQGEKKVISYWDDNQSFKLFGGLRGEYISTRKKIDPYYTSGLIYEYKNELLTITSKTKAETTYRLPSFSSLFWVNNSSTAGNPDLKPEFGFSKETGIYLTLNKYLHSRFSFEIFDKDLDNLIIWTKKSDGTYTPENLNGGEIKGIESSAEFFFFNDDLKVNFFYNTLDTETKTDNNATNGKHIIYKPVDTFGAGFNLNIKSLSFDYKYTLTGKTYVTTSNMFPMDPFEIHDVKLSYTYKLVENSEFSCFIKCNNLFDEQYQTVYGYPMPGRSIESGIIYKF